MKKNIAEIIKTSKEIYNNGLVSGKSGNISVRFKKNDIDMIAITPTSRSLGDLSEKDIVLVDLDGNVLTKGTPSSEVGMHLGIYNKRDDINAIVHTHSPYATGFAFSSKKLKKFEGFKNLNSPYISSVEYEKPGSVELATSVSEKIGDEDVLILNKHGVICLGENLKEAKELAFFVEETAKTQFVSIMLNSVEDI